MRARERREGSLYEMLAENEELRSENEQLRQAVREREGWLEDLLSERVQIVDEMRNANLRGRRAQVELWMQKAAGRRGVRNSAQARAKPTRGQIELVLAVNDKRQRDPAISIADAVRCAWNRAQERGGFRGVRGEPLGLSRCGAIVNKEWKKHGGRHCITLPIEREQELRNALHGLSQAQRLAGVQNLNTVSSVDSTHAATIPLSMHRQSQHRPPKPQ